MSPYWYIIIIPFLGLFLTRKDLRREMIISGLLSIPILIIKPALSPHFFDQLNFGQTFIFFLTRLIVGFCIGAIASAIYETFFHKILTPERHPHRQKLLYLLTGPILLFLLFLVFKVNFAYAIAASLLLDIIVLIFIRADLIWDMIFSAFSMATLYVVIFLISFRALPGDLNDFWFLDRLSSFVIFSIPVEEIIIVMLFGALWGPLYVAIKDYREK